MDNSASVLSQIKEAIKNTDPNAVAILYGSRATGKARKGSDWDILILLNQPVVSIKQEQLFRHNLYDIEIETEEPISTFVYSVGYWNTCLSDTPLYHAVTQNGIVL